MVSAPRICCLAVAIAVLVSAPAPGAPPVELHYVKKDTRQATRAAALAQHQTPLQWSAWSLAGPFDNTGRDKHDVVYPPELGVDLQATYRGKGGRQVAWRRIEHAGWGPIDLARFEGQGANTDGIAYLCREVVAERAGDAAFEMGSDDGLKVWLNGRLLVDADVYRGLNIQDHVVTLPLGAGVNRLLVKVTQGVGSWQFQMRPRTDPRLLALLEYRLDQDFPPRAEARHYRILTVLEPPDVVLEVGGLDVDDAGRPVVTTRRGEAWLIEGAYEQPPFDCRFIRFAAGLHEPLGALWHDRALLVAQRGELTRLTDLDGDDVADLYETVSDAWGVSGNYHEFAFGPKLDGQGRLWVTLNLGFCGSLGKSTVPWRGWAVIIEPDGTLVPVCGGLRSPNGIGAGATGDVFCTDNQGDWIATCKLAHLDFGDWHGHPAGARPPGAQWYERAGYRTPQEQDFKPPAVWFPYGRMGQSASDVLLDDSAGRFGPFTGQLFVGDQTNATVMRVFLERVGAAWQGACFPFLEGFACGVNRMALAPDGSMFVGLTNRGWGSLGSRSWGIQRVVYTGLEPFEVLSMEARPAGFLLRFTKPVDPGAAGDPASYAMSSFTYYRHEEYGSPEIDVAEHVVTGAAVAADGRAVELSVQGLRAGYVHELHLDGVRSSDGQPLLHRQAYYTLNRIPAGR